MQISRRKDTGFREDRYKLLGPKYPYRRSSSSKKIGMYDSAMVMPAKFGGTCNSCLKEFTKGTSIIYNKYTFKVYHHPKCP